MVFTNYFAFACWLFIALFTNIYATEYDSSEKSTLSYHQLIEIMEEIEEAKTTPETEPSSAEKEIYPKGNSCQKDYFMNLPTEIVSKILDMVLLYKDQLSFLMCASSWCTTHAKNISKTHIYRLKEASDQTFSLNFLVNLKYLWISNCDIPSIKFTANTLTALAVRWSNIDSSLLLNQRSLSYLDVRTINKPLISASSLSHLGINPQMSNRMVFSCEHDVLLSTLKNNKDLMVLKLNITNDRGLPTQGNIYENLPELKSIEFVDINNDLTHLDHPSGLQHVQEIILSSFEKGLMEAHYKQALKIIAQKIRFTDLKLKCINMSDQWEILYTKDDLKKVIGTFLS